MISGQKAEMAVQLKSLGVCNCAQAVAAVLADQTGLTAEELKNITAGFCAGMGTMEATCGALIGAGVIAGLSTKGEGTLKLTRQLLLEFKELSGATICKDLKTIIDGKPLCPCEQCVKNAVIAYCNVFGIKE